MSTLYLHLSAPFAAFRTMQAGYRATSPVMPPSAAYGLVLNLAAVQDTDDFWGTGATRKDAPIFRVAVGRLGPPPEVAVLYNQLHVVPVGDAGKAAQERVKGTGTKPTIRPIRREVLVGFQAVLAVEAPTALCEQVRAGLRGDLPRTGLPFLGENDMVLERLDLIAEPPPANWMLRWSGGPPPVHENYLLSVRLDRDRHSNSESAVFYPSPLTAEIPPEAWVQVGPI